jgi:hypothetical protein
MENMMKSSYPKYRIDQWLDTSEKALRKKTLPIRYGVGVKPSASAAWAHGANSKGPLIFDSADKAQAVIHRLRAKAK